MYLFFSLLYYDVLSFRIIIFSTASRSFGLFSKIITSTLPLTLYLFCKIPTAVDFSKLQPKNWYVCV